jgi:hypothetical protein
MSIPNNTDPEQLQKFEKLKTILGNLDDNALKSLGHVTEMLKIQDPIQRLEYLNKHREDMESDRNMLVQLFEDSGLISAKEAQEARKATD